MAKIARESSAGGEDDSGTAGQRDSGGGQDRPAGTPGIPF